MRTRSSGRPWLPASASPPPLCHSRRRRSGGRHRTTLRPARKGKRSGTHTLERDAAANQKAIEQHKSAREDAERRLAELHAAHTRIECRLEDEIAGRRAAVEEAVNDFLNGATLAATHFAEAARKLADSAGHGGLWAHAVTASGESVLAYLGSRETLAQHYDEHEQ